MLQIAQSLAAAFADEEGESLDAAVAAFVAAREAHALTVGVPAPVAHPLVERIVLVERGVYEIVDDPPQPPSEPATSARRPELWAIANLTIANGEISGFELGSGLAGALALDVGEYLFFIDKPLDTDVYQVRAWDDDGIVATSVPRQDRTADTFTVRCRSAGVPVDPETLNIQICR